MVAISRPIDPTAGLTCKCDAWNRPVDVQIGVLVRFRARYDGLNRSVQAGVAVGRKRGQNY